MKRIAAAIVIGLASSAVMATGQPGFAHATSSAHPATVSYVAGDAQFLVYTRDQRYHPPVIYVRSATGKVRDLGPVVNRTRDLVDFSLVGSTLTSGDLQGNVSWWNLATHTSGSLKLKSPDRWVSSVPGGFVYLRQTKSGYNNPDFREFIASGKVNRIHPLFGGLLTGPTGYVGVLAHNQLAYEPYDGGPLVDLTIPAKYRAKERDCDEMWQFYVRCVMSSGHVDNNGTTSIVMVPLNGAKPFGVKPTFGPVPLGHELVWGESHLTVRSTSGKITKTKTAGPVTGEAFESAIVAPANGRKLLGVASPASKPKTLAHP